MRRLAHGDPCGWSLSAVVGMIVLVPYLTAVLPFESSLYVQAGCILFGVLGLLAISWRWSGRSGIADRGSSPLLIGFALYFVAAVVGTGIGLWRGNGIRDLAGQTFSMGLLPLAGLAGAAADVPGRRRRLAWTLVGATAAICWIHLGDGLLQIARGEPVRSMILANGVTASGPTLIALPLALASALREPSRSARVTAWLAVGTIVSYAVGCGIRSLWIALLVAVPVFLLLGGEWRRLLRPRFLGAALALLLALVTALVLTRRWIDTGEIAVAFPSPALAGAAGEPRPATLQRWEERQPVSLTPSREIPPGSWYRLEACLADRSWGAARVTAVWLDRDGRRLGRLPLELAPSVGDASVCVTRFGRPPGTTESSRLEIVPLSNRGEWRIRSVTLKPLGSGPGVSMAVQIRALSDRLFSLLEMLQVDELLRAEAAPRAQTETIRFRWHETSRLMTLFRNGTLPEQLLGHGLGARYRLDRPGWDNRGNWVYYEDVNYIHNFFAFLLYKLGILGGVLVLAALAVWLVWGVKRARRPDRSLEQAWVAAGAAAMIAATLWSLSSPAFLNFRLAPLWGLLLASMSPRARSDERVGQLGEAGSRADT